MGDGYFIGSSGSAKPYTKYLLGMRHLYESGHISFVDYLTYIGTFRIMAYGESEESVLAWIEEQVKKEGVTNVQLLCGSPDWISEVL